MSLNATAKVRRRKAVIEFSALPTHPDVTFQCKLNRRGRFKPCECIIYIYRCWRSLSYYVFTGTSPKSYRLSNGEHTVTVRATCPDQSMRPRKTLRFTVGRRQT